MALNTALGNRETVNNYIGINELYYGLYELYKKEGKLKKAEFYAVQANNEAINEKKESFLLAALMINKFNNDIKNAEIRIKKQNGLLVFSYLFL